MKMKTKRLLYSAAVLLGTSFYAAAGAQEAEIEYDTSPEALIVTYDKEYDSIPNPTNKPLLQVFGDGTVVVTYPSFMKNAGEYTTKLSAEGMDALLQDLAETGVLDFDAKAAKQAVKQEKMREIEEAKSTDSLGIVQVRSKETVYKLSVSLDSFADGKGSESEPVNLKVSYYGINQDAKKYKSVEALADLAAAVAVLEGVVASDDLQKMEDGQ